MKIAAKKRKTYKVLMAFFTLIISLAPKYCAITMVVPDAIPIINEIRVNIIGKEAPTAARASFPIKFPTMILSTILYNCWNTLPSNMGNANWKITLLSFPVVRSFTLNGL
ncbi:hypothetical protein ES705_38561 [subsurface metagenome]